MSVNELELGEITAADFLVELRRIADALDKPPTCREQHGEAICILDEGHAGHHVPRDGRLRWLDD